MIAGAYILPRIFFLDMKVVAKYFLSRKYQNLKVQTNCNFSVFNNTLKSKVNKWKEILQNEFSHLSIWNTWIKFN